MELDRRWARQILASTAVAIAAILASARADDGASKAPSQPFTPDQLRFFEGKVRPILETRCLKCHGGGGKVKGGFRLDSRTAVLIGGDLGPAVDAEKPDESLLLQAIRYQELEMPPGGKLPAVEQEILTRWVKGGLPWGSQPAPAAPVAVSAPTGPASAESIAAARREWSHQPVVGAPRPRG
jgi:hypothetical protein